MKTITKKGFTLIEVLIAATIFAMVMVMVVGIFSWASSYNSKLREMRKVNQEARKIMNMVSDDIRQANGGLSISLAGGAVETIGELAILDVQNIASTLIEDFYITSINADIDLLSPHNRGLIIVDVVNKTAIVYIQDSNLDIYRNEIDADEVIDYSDIGWSSSERINSGGVDIKLGFAGHTPLISDRKAQPFIKIKMLAETEDYENVINTYRTRLNLETTVTSREYNIFE